MSDKDTQKISEFYTPKEVIMMVCPYKEMKNLQSLPCAREERGDWIYCNFCGQKTRKEILLDPIDRLIGFLVFMLIVVLMANSLGSGTNSTEPINTNWDRVDTL